MHCWVRVLLNKYSIAFSSCVAKAIGQPLDLPNFSLVYLTVIESGLNTARGYSRTNLMIPYHPMTALSVSC